MSHHSLVTSTLLSKHSNVKCGISTRTGGVSPEPYGMNLSFNVGDVREQVLENRRRLFALFGTTSDRVAVPRQQHTANSRRVSVGGSYEECDALMTDVANVFLAVSVADCTPIFLCDTVRQVVAAVHAGWRGTEQGILMRTMEALMSEYGSGPQNILAFIGPSAGSCCYEVGKDVADKFEEEFKSHRSNKIYLDIKSANKQQLIRSGIAEHNIEVSGDCTICNPALYHSYRRDKEKSGRMMGLIGICS
jgi:YfiH family protein